jgi:hypothetical protein
MTIAISGTTGITLDGQFNSASSMGFKNRIINGAMVIDQRNAGASVTPVNGAYTLDRWVYSSSQASKFTVEQTITGVAAPVGFSDYLGATVASAVTIGAGDFFSISQSIEGFNFADMAWGTASASTVTLSFWVRSSLTGTFGGALRNSAGNRSYPFTYTISSANTWEQKSVTIAGDTSGTWIGATNGIGVTILFGLGVGSTYSGTAGAWAGSNFLSATGATSVVGTNGATFYITGVQLEKGSTATSFDYRPYGTELALCQRYYYRRNYDQTTNDLLATFHAYSSGGAWGKIIDLPVEMRATPTGGLSSIGHFRPTNSTGSNQAAFTAGTLAGQGTSKSQLTTAGWSGSSGLTAGNATVITTNTASAWIDASAEL